MLPYNSKLKPNARILRSNMTDAEQFLWVRVRRKQILGVQFYRQKPIGQFVVDFYAPRVGLVIELDGEQHFEQEQQHYDQRRSLFLEQQGLTVLRFTNLDVFKNIEGVMEMIFCAVQRKLERFENPPYPPQQRGDNEAASCSRGSEDVASASSIENKREK
jgi:very-short-patch-repair endonuclease